LFQEPGEFIHGQHPPLGVNNVYRPIGEGQLRRFARDHIQKKVIGQADSDRVGARLRQLFAKKMRGLVGEKTGSVKAPVMPVFEVAHAEQVAESGGPEDDPQHTRIRADIQTVGFGGNTGEETKRE
jgi:hypothetical protein